MQTNRGNMVIWVVVVLVVVGGLIYFTINKKESLPVETESTSEEVINNEEKTVNNDTSAKQEEAKQTAEVQVAEKGDIVAMNYTGRLTNGTVFDSNVDPKFGHVEPFIFPLGAGRVIAGWDEGIVGMKVGEKKTLTISPEKGYGSTAHGPIPANSTLIFDVELLAVKKAQ